MTAANTFPEQPGHQCVLIISEDTDMAQVWKTLFEKHTIPAICESSLQSGLSTARILSPALILLNVDVPAVERLALCRELRTTTDGALLMVESNFKNPDILEYHRAGVDETMSTSINPMALVIKSLAWLARYDWVAPYKSPMQMWT